MSVATPGSEGYSPPCRAVGTILQGRMGVLRGIWGAVPVGMAASLETASPHRNEGHLMALVTVRCFSTNVQEIRLKGGGRVFQAKGIMCKLHRERQSRSNLSKYSERWDILEPGVRWEEDKD